jgi:hypothetical protein
VRKGIFLLLMVLAAVAVGSGCGGGGDNDEQALTKAQYLRQANAICTKGDEAKTEALSVAAQKKSRNETRLLDKKDLEDLATDVALPAVRKMVGELSELVPPEKDKEKVEAIIDSMEVGLDEIEDEPKKFVSGDAFLKVDKLADAYGLTACVL